MAGAAWSPQKDDGDRLYPKLTEKCQDALSRLVSLEPRELCSEAIVEKCRATRDLRSCGRIVEHSLTSCNHASLCAECGQRCDVCPICRAPIRRHGPSMRTRLYEEFCEAGLITEDRRERDGHPNADVQRLWSFFDVALEYKLVSVICHYVSDVCMDDRAVSSNAIVSMLLDGTVVKDWCKRTFLHTTRNLQDIYCLGIMHMKNKEGVMERFATKLLGLIQVLESLEGPLLDATSAPIFELQQLLEGARRVSQHLDVMCWCARHHFLENIQSSHSSLNDWRSAVKGRKLAANSRAWPECTRNVSEVTSYTSATLFIEDAMANIGFGKDNDRGENLELGYLRPTTALTTLRRKEGIGGQSSVRVSAAVYPPESVRAAVDMIFLEASADLFLAKKAIFLYYLFDRHWPNHDDEWKQLLDDYVLTFDISRHAMLESRVFFLLDEVDGLALEEACRLLPEVVSFSIHPKVARVLLERQKPHVALDVLHCGNGDGSFRLSGSTDKDEIPALQDAVTAVRVRLECGLLTDAYLYQRSYISRVKGHAQKYVVSTSKFDSEEDYRDWLSEMELLVGEICWLCVQKNLVAKLLELPWHEDEERILVKCLLQQATRDPCSTAGSLMVMFYIMRCRNREAYLVHKRLSTIERSFLDQCGDVEKSEIVKSIYAQRTTLVEKGVELLPKIQQDQLRTGSLDQLLPPTEEKKGAGFEMPGLKPMFPAVQAEMRTSTSPASIPLDGKSDSLLLSHKASPDLMGWGNYRQPSILHGKPFKATSGVSDVLSHLNLAANNGATPQKEYTEGLLGPILGKKLIYNVENELTPFSTRNLRATFAQEAKGSNHDEVQNFLFPTPNASSSDVQEFNGGAVPVLSFDKSESNLHDDDGRMVFNERVQNGASFLADNGPGAAVPLFRWSENGAMEKRESSRSDNTFDLTTREAKYRPRRQMIHSSPNGKRKAHDQLDVCLQDATEGDIFPADSFQRTGSEQQKGLLLSGADVNNAYTMRKNGVRWRTEDDSLDSPPRSISGGRIKAFNGIGRASSGSRSFRSQAL
eukprot:c24838_g1_i1 orf=214-3336(+)